MRDLPVIDVAPLVTGRGDVGAVAAAIDVACRDRGFFYVVGHGIDDELQQRLDDAARVFFSLPDDEKAAIAMVRGGRAWRGWFPVGGELTDGVPDRKEGLYFGTELGPSDAAVVAGRPLHGPNLFPSRPAALRPAVLAYLDAMTALGHALLAGLAVAVGHDAEWFRRHLTADPTVLFRIFHYPPSGPSWGVAEHTDYGLLTILRQDATGGLEVRTGSGWVVAPPIPGSFVVNLGDAVQALTGGAYRSTPHRVRNTGAVGRLSFPFFIDPGWDVVVPGLGRGTYGEHLVGRVARVFPELGVDVLPPGT